jgi:SAM-dependent methyltransferase
MDSTRNSRLLTSIKEQHDAFVFRRRVRVLAEALASEIPQRGSVLDIGCGDGSIASVISRLRPDIAIQGVEVMARPTCRIKCTPFDGAKLPFPDGAFDLCLFVDVLHHTTDIATSLKEAARVSRCFVLIKDHASENWLDHSTLSLMDWVANRPHGVKMTYNYQSREQWSQLFRQSGLRESVRTEKIDLYPVPFNLAFGRGLHFISLLRKTDSSC